MAKKNPLLFIPVKRGEQTHLHTSGPVGHNGFQIVGEARPRRRELHAAQRMAIRARIGRPNRAPQRTPAQLAITSPNSTGNWLSAPDGPPWINFDQFGTILPVNST